MSQVRKSNKREELKIVTVGSESDYSWKVEFYDDFHIWAEKSDPISYDQAVTEMKRLAEEMAWVDDGIKHRLRIRKVGSDDFIMNDVLC